MRHGEGCFSPAHGRKFPGSGPDWNNPAGRGSGPEPGNFRPAGPRAFRVPGRVVDTPLQRDRPPGNLGRPVFLSAVVPDSCGHSRVSTALDRPADTRSNDSVSRFPGLERGSPVRAHFSAPVGPTTTEVA